MRKISLTLLTIATLLLSTNVSMAHPGRTDSNGGHTCRTDCAKWGLKDGEYHYHNSDGTIKTKTPSDPKVPTAPTSPLGPTSPDEPEASGIKADKIKPPAKDKLSVYFLNVGQGDATYIKTAAGDDILIDAGKNEAGAAVVNYLKQLGVDDLEILISTHPDEDHAGGLDVVLDKFKVKAVYAPKVSHTTNTFKDFLLAVKKEGLTIKEAKAGVKLPLKDVTATFVGPVKQYGDDLNDWSAVLHLTYGENTFLFTGDAEKKAENDMIAAKLSLKADVLKTGHHGSVSSTSPALLKAVSPKFAIISVGKNNYGHPAATILNRLKSAKVTTFRTDLNGTVTAVSDGKKISFVKVK
ncbi:MBL fold metallo-hydrolase [Cohnella cholangitidis]|uniref:MBL fold metallo-hydrolase n=1 Tax=Cohnella cholangitidis TaxID=2598458 RepID=A0A7G5BTQ8_9BACL|nr:MBL fold metallo-hydrolase [Cohnella cholangitidis]QMV40342.1 MBL fold metallo-hydrolase [Cohnella cholangitidis]